VSQNKTSDTNPHDLARAAVAVAAIACSGPAAPAAPAPGFDAAAFHQVFHDGAVVVNGVRLHYVEGGRGDPILLVPGWPQSWYAWRFIMPTLVAAGHRVVAVDLRGMGDSDHPQDGYDGRTVARDLHEFVAALDLAKGGKLTVAAHDVGAWMGYAYAADWPGDVHRLVLMEAALPGITPPAPAGIASDAANTRTWHFAFNRLPDLPELLVQGHERAYLGWLFAQKSARPWVFTPQALDEYERVFVQPGGARSAFAYYRAAFGDAGLRQNRERAERMLELPVLTVGGQHGVGDLLRDTMQAVARDVRGVQIADCGHFVLEECPEEVSDELLRFVRTARVSAP
jgi:pimeloyl-ACP methyl ester carboxylesterase